MKYLGKNLAKYIQDVYEENYKTGMKGVKEELNKWREIPCSWIVKIHVNIVKMSVLPNLIYRFNTIKIRIPISYLWIETNCFLH